MPMPLSKRPNMLKVSSFSEHSMQFPFHAQPGKPWRLGNSSCHSRWCAGKRLNIALSRRRTRNQAAWEGHRSTFQALQFWFGKRPEFVGIGNNSELSVHLSNNILWHLDTSEAWRKVVFSCKGIEPRNLKQPIWLGMATPLPKEQKHPQWQGFW